MHPRTLLPALALTLLVATGCGQESSTADDPEPTTSESPRRTPGESTTPARTPTASPVVPLGGLPLTRGWPTGEELGSDGRVVGPRRGLDPIEATACGVTTRVDVTDRVDARLEAPEDYRSRAVGTYPDEPAAATAAVDLVQPFRDCRSEPSGALTRTHRVSGEPTGERGALVTTSFAMEGTPAIGVQSMVVVRRGRTLVVALWSTEGTGQQRAREMARTDAAQLQPLLAELR